MALQNYGAFFDLAGAGVTGPLLLRSSSGGLTVDLSSQQWTYQVYLYAFIYLCRSLLCMALR